MRDEQTYWDKGFLFAILIGIFFIIHIIIRPICLRNGLSLDIADFIMRLYDSITTFIIALALFFLSLRPNNSKESDIYSIICSVIIFISGIFTFANALKLL